MAESRAMLTHRGSRAVQRMVEFAPCTGGLALWVRHEDLPGPGAAGPAPGPPVVTDGATIYYSVAFEALPRDVQTGLVAHETLHIALRHPQRYLELQGLLGDVDPALYNVCADAVVNSALAHLGWLALPRGSVFLDQLLASALGVTTSVETALLEWSVERLYRAIDDRAATQRGASGASAQPGAGSRSPGQRHGADARPRSDAPTPAGAQRADGPRAGATRSLGLHILADLRPDQRARGEPQDQAQQSLQWSERLLRAHAGDGEHSMLRTLLADLPRTRVPWEQVLRVRLARALSLRRDVSWSRPTRSYLANQGRCGAHGRLPWEPGTAQSRRVPRLVVAVDVSGSIDAALVSRFAREVEAISRRLQATVIVVIGDDQVRHVERFEPGSPRAARLRLGGVAIQGGGGTDFTPLLEEADKHRPDLVVFLTDLEGPARFRPRWPVLWAVPEARADAVVPFGRMLVLD